MMDDITRTELQSILDQWVVAESCPYCQAGGVTLHRKYASHSKDDSILGKVQFEGMIELDLVHASSCPYSRIATLIGKGNRQFWQSKDR